MSKETITSDSTFDSSVATTSSFESDTSSDIFAISRDGNESISQTCSNVQVQIRKVPSAPTLLGLNYLRQPAELHIEELRKIVENDPIYKRENLADYNCNGEEVYMPLYVNQTFGLNDKFKAIRKLGHGCFSSVWLCKDTIDEDYVALKICKSGQAMRYCAFDEIALLKHISYTEPKHPGFQKIVHIKDSLVTHQNNKVHVCLSLEVLGPSLVDLLVNTHYRGFEVKVVKNIIRQVLLGLTYLHEKCRIIHTDLKPDNILIEVGQAYVNNLVQEVNQFHQFGVKLPHSYVSAIQYVGDGDKNDIGDVKHTRTDTNSVAIGHVRQFYNSVPRGTFKERLAKKVIKPKEEMESCEPALMNPNMKVKIADLGNASRDTDRKMNLISTVQYRAFEVLINELYSFPADLWSVACITYELLMGQYLFLPQDLKKVSANEHHVSLITNIVGDIPKEVALKGLKSLEIFNKDGVLRCRDKIPQYKRSLKKIFTKFLSLNETDAINCEEFLLSLLEPNQTRRATATEALGNVWLNE